ncbi:MAG TPA: chromosome partitioning protein ParB, partial [Planctomycetaceae bacterium]|nr:chromosome partitioning protein ParB [Planctomycetaceae bacterium]
MKIEQWPIKKVKPYANNPRKNDHAVEQVARSIEEYGFRQPIVVDEAGIIVVGHTRWKAANMLKLKEVPVHVAKGLTEAQIKAYRIADNKTNELAEWDLDLLPLELAALSELDYDIDVLGFTSDELAEIMQPEQPEPQTDPDDVPEPPDEAITKPGDLWILGDHRLLCGDSSKPEDLDRLLDGQPIHLVNMDPPYNVKVEPRSNNAISAGNSSFAKSTSKTHHQKF